MLNDLLLLRLIKGSTINLTKVKSVSKELSSLCCTYPHLKTKMISYLKDNQASDDFIKELLEMSCIKTELQDILADEQSVST